MKFGEFELDEAEGLMLAHALQLPGALLPKGHVLLSSDISRLADNGVTRVTAVRIDGSDVDENEAARTLSASIKSGHVRFSQATTGRVNVFSTCKGLFVANRAAVDRLNSIDPALTIACLADHSRVDIGTMIATIKIIPLAVSRQTIRNACNALEAEQPFAIKPFEEFIVSLVATHSAKLKTSVMDKTAGVLARRLEDCGNRLDQEIRIPHRTDALAEVLRHYNPTSSNGRQLVVIFGASAVIDEADVIPQAIKDAGGKIIRVGMPVDPGNLLVLGAIPGVGYVIGAPGCARSPKENGFDWVLHRILACEHPDGHDLSSMGVGGLLMEIPTRGFPRETSTEKSSTSVAVLLLAAGGKVPARGELIPAFDLASLAKRATLAAIRSEATSVTVIVGHQKDLIRRTLSSLPVTVIENHHYQTGIAGSVIAGFSSDSVKAADGVLVMFADMPLVTGAALDQLIQAFKTSDGASIVRAVANGKHGNPVILPQELRDCILHLEGDVGARHIIETSGLPIIDVELGEAAVVDANALY